MSYLFCAYSDWVRGCNAPRRPQRRHHRVDTSGVRFVWMFCGACRSTDIGRLAPSARSRDTPDVRTPRVQPTVERVEGDNVTSTYGMFRSASSFNQNIGHWAPARSWICASCSTMLRRSTRTSLVRDDGVSLSYESSGTYYARSRQHPCASTLCGVSIVIACARHARDSTIRSRRGVARDPMAAAASATFLLGRRRRRALCRIKLSRRLRINGTRTTGHRYVGLVLRLFNRRQLRRDCSSFNDDIARGILLSHEHGADVPRRCSIGRSAAGGSTRSRVCGQCSPPLLTRTSVAGPSTTSRI